MFKKIPILMYHSVCNDKNHLSIGVKKFEKQLNIINKLGFKTVHFGDSIEKIKKPLVITFDDGYEDVYLNALPLLKKFNLKATCFIVSNLTGLSNIWDEDKKKFKKKKLMNFDQINKWLNSNMDIGSHTLNHNSLTEIPLSDAETEIYQSKKDLESMFKVNINSFSYPYGMYNNLISSIVRKHYNYGVTTKRSRFIMHKHDPSAIPRVHINNNTNSLKIFHF